MNAGIEQWRTYVQRQSALTADDVEELEAHLSDQIDDLTGMGLSDDEAFLIAVGRVGRIDEVSQEFAREHSERLWKQLVLGPQRTDERRPTLAAALVTAVAAAIAVRVPAMLGATEDFYVVNAALLVVPFLAGYFLWERKAGWRLILTVVLAFAILVGVVNAYPLASGGTMQALVAINVPVVAWFLMGLSYVAGNWRDHVKRMDFVRFTGEWIVYYALIALGGGVLTALALAGFQAVGLDAEPQVTAWVVPCGAAGAVIVAAWLVESKQAVVENIAPVLTAVFTPLTILLLAAYLLALIAGGDLVFADRDLLILADLILVLVLGLVLYSVSARDPLQAPGWFDRLQAVLLVLAVAVDVLMLAAMSGRILEFGASANKVAALGLNVLLLVNLVGAAWLGVGFLRGVRGFFDVERWQTAYLPAFAVWPAIIVFGFPLAFGWQ